MNITKLSVINDEISNNFDESLNFLTDNNIKYVELRYIDDKNILDHSVDDIIKIKAKLDDRGIQVSALASPLFKWCPEENNPGGSELNHSDLMFGFNMYVPKDKKIDYIAKAFIAAEILGTKNIRIFSLIKEGNKENDFFWNEEKDLYESVFVSAKGKQINLLLENGLSTYFYSPSQIINFEKLYSDKFKLLLDIGNTYVIGQPLKVESFEKIVNIIDYIHLKDFDDKTNKVVEMGKGIIPYKQLFQVLTKNNYSGVFSIEPEGKENKINLVQNSINYIRRLEI